MTQRKVSEPTQDQWGADVHPAFGMISAHRGTYGGGGAVLFDSDVQHQETITVRIHHASRQRDLSRDWLNAGNTFVEVELSLAQWASFVSSLNTVGVPCTIRRTEADILVDDIPYAPRLADSIEETRAAADEAFRDIQEALKAYTANKTAANLRTLEARVQNARPNVEFAGKQLTKYAEDVVQRARADIEAMVLTHAQRLGLDPADASRLTLETGDD